MKPGYNGPSWAPYQLYATSPGGLEYEYASYTEAAGPTLALQYCLQQFPKSEGWTGHRCRNLNSGLDSRLGTALPLDGPERTALPL